jgi:RepB DNA-primase from phage plasmid
MASRRFLVVVSGAKVYVAAHPLRSDRRKRTKDSIATVLHLCLDFDIDGEARLTSLPTSDTVPTPTAILSISLGKYQILSRIDSFTFEQQESTLKLLAIPFGGDPACTDCKRAFRLPGFRNCRHDPSYPIPSSTPAIRLRFPVTFGWIFRRQMTCLCPMQSHRESTPESTLIPNTIGRGSYTNLPTETMPRISRERFLLAARITPVALASLFLNACVPMEGVCYAAGGPPPLRDCLCVVYPKRHKLGMRWSRLRRSLQLGWSPRLLYGC